VKNIMIVVLAGSLLIGASTYANKRDLGLYGFGPRVGFTVNPDQIHVGGHIDVGDIATDFMILPNVEIGFGDDLTVIAPSFEVDYRFHSDWGAWTPYLGGGLGPVFYSHEGGGDATEFAAYLQFGIGKGSTGSQSGHFFIEGKLGLADAPDFKATVGWTFGR
jgi:hypothetical protein